MTYRGIVSNGVVVLDGEPSGREASRQLNLDSDDAWKWLGAEIGRLAEGGA